MRDRAGFFAACADSLSEMCFYYAAAAVLIMGRGWGVHLFWLLLWTAVCLSVFTLVLKKPRTVPALTVLTGLLVLTGFGLFALISATPMRFGYGFVLAVGAGMAAGVPLHFALHRPKILSHLTQLDVLIGVLLFLLIARDALALDGWTIALTTLVLFLDAAAAVGLRMSEGGDAEGGSAFKASMTALVSAAALTLLVALLSLLFSGSAGVTDAVLRGVGGFFAALGGVVERFMRWLAGLFTLQEHYDAADPELDMPSVAAAELGGGAQLSVNTTALGIILCALAVGAAAAVAVLLRRHIVSLTETERAYGGEAGVRRTGGAGGEFWRRLRAALCFRWTAFLRRDTPAGLLVLLERMGKRARAPRGAGETMRSFLARMDPAGGLAELADALDRQYYGGGGGMDRKSCRELRRYIRRTLRRAQPRRPQKAGGSR